MDHTTTLETWKSLIKKLESNDGSTDSATLIKELQTLFEHLSPQTALRIQKEFESCTLETEHLLGELFDKIDLSDKPLLARFLKMLRAFGYFRISQITYHTETSRDEFNLSNLYLPAIEKAKWYQLTPLLPNAGTLGWKGLMNHCLVEEEPELMKTCLHLLTQKLHFYSLVLTLRRFQIYSENIKRNGKRVAEKLFELIRDTSFDDESMIGIDATLFNLMLPFTDKDQQIALVDAVVHDLFKPHLLQKPVKESDMSQLQELVKGCIINTTTFQDTFITKLLEHLKCNLIRRKRRHSVEVTPESGKISLETLIDTSGDTGSLLELSAKVEDLELSTKPLQTAYISFWLETLNQLIPFKTLTASSSFKIIYTSATLLITTSSLISEELAQDLIITMIKCIQNCGQPTKLFTKTCDIQFLTNLTEVFLNRTSLLLSFDSPILPFYKVYLARFLTHSLHRGSTDEIEKLSVFIDFISNMISSKESARLLQFTYIHEVGRVLNSDSKCSNKNADILVKYARTCSNNMYKFVKRNFDDQELGVEILVSILKIGLIRKDQHILDSYGDPILRLFESITNRMKLLLEGVEAGRQIQSHPLDTHIPKLMLLYINHQDIIKVYLNFDFIESMLNLITQKTDIHQSNGIGDIWKDKKKLVYNEIKLRLDDIETRANDQSGDVFKTIINKLSVCPIGDIKKEQSCLRNYSEQMSLMYQVFTTLVHSDIKYYKRTLESTLYVLENCDPLDHPKLLLQFLMLEILIKKPHPQLFKSLSNLSSSLIRISKMVELGPSIHVFTQPGSHKTNKSIQCCTYSNCIKIYTLVFRHLPPNVTQEYITDGMQMCTNANLIQYSEYSTRFHRYFLQLSSAMIGLLFAVSLCKKEESLSLTTPVYLSVFSNFIRCLIIASDRQKLEELNTASLNGTGNTLRQELDEKHQSRRYESQLELLALEVGKVLNNLSSSRVKMIDYAPHLISTYIKDIQRAPCAESVRLHLNEGIFRIFNLIDAHQKERQEEIIEAGVQRKCPAGKASGSLFDMIHARLDQASREIFHDMHQNYNRFFRYLGKY